MTQIDKNNAFVRKPRHPAEIKPVEGRRQFFDAADRARLTGQRGSAAMQLSLLGMRAMESLSPDLTLESTLTSLLTLAQLGAKQVNRNRAAQLIDDVTPETLSQTLATARSVAAYRIRRARSDLRRRPREIEKQQNYRDALIPPAMAALTGRDDITFWDATQDGHIAPKHAAYALGIVRWARMLTGQTMDRISQAFDGADVVPETVGNVWIERRPLIFIDRWTVITTKLVEDAWAADPSIAVVIPEPMPLPVGIHALGIPVVTDKYRHIAALMPFDRTPVVIEPRLGGVTITAPSGLISFTQRDPVVPAWMQTLALVGAVERMTKTMLEADERLNRDARQKVLDRFLFLTQRVKRQPGVAVPKNVGDTLASERARYVQTLETVKARLTAWVEAAGASHA